MCFARAVLEEVFIGGDDANADDIVVLGDIPEPAVFAFDLNHERRAFVAAGVAIGAFPVGPERGFFQNGIPLAQVETIHDDGALAAGIDYDFRTDFLFGSVFFFDLHADRTLAFPNDAGDVDAFFDGDTVLLGIAEHHFVKFATDDLPGL